MVKLEGIEGIDELIASLDKLEPAYKQKVVVFLDRLGRKALLKTARNTRVLERVWAQRKKGELRKSWELLTTKHYRDGNVSVVRIESDSNYAHLMENDHHVYTARRKKNGLRKKIARSSTKEIEAAGVQKHGIREGDKMLARAMESTQSGFDSGIDKIFDELISEF